MSEKKYYLQHRAVRFFDQYDEYLNYDTYDNDYSLGDNVEDERYKTTFTEKEIQRLKDKYISVLTEFEQIEVE